MVNDDVSPTSMSSTLHCGTPPGSSRQPDVEVAKEPSAAVRELDTTTVWASLGPALLTLTV